MDVLLGVEAVTLKFQIHGIPGIFLDRFFLSAMTPCRKFQQRSRMSLTSLICNVQLSENMPVSIKGIDKLGGI